MSKLITRLVNQYYSKILNFIQDYVLESPRFKDGDLVQHLNGDEVFAVVGTYYDFNLKPQLFIMDSEHRIYGANSIDYKLATNMEKIQSANY